MMRKSNFIALGIGVLALSALAVVKFCPGNCSSKSANAGFFPTLNAQTTVNGPEIGTNIGDKAPEIAMKNPEGKILKLSDLKGHIVLIDFWASWCRPCRFANRHLVQVYNKYKDKDYARGKKGFTIFSVSLDQRKASWVKAIELDNLTWQWHVSDLRGWSNASARTYGVNSIPRSYLIDGNGIIVAINPKGDALNQQLEALLK